MTDHDREWRYVAERLVRHVGIDSGPVALLEKVVPYLHAEAIAGIREGLPLMRAMAFEAPDDAHISAYPLQFFAGRDRSTV